MTWDTCAVGWGYLICMLETITFCLYLGRCFLIYHLYGLRLVVFFFFFSSRRRHTRSDRDWISDVCSSDLHKPHPERDGCFFPPRELTVLRNPSWNGPCPDCPLHGGANGVPGGPWCTPISRRRLGDRKSVV